MTRRWRPILVAFAILAVAIVAGFLTIGRATPKPTNRTITVLAEKYGYTPAVIRVNKGDRITLRLKAKDVTHGFYLESYDLEAKARPEMPDFWVRNPSKGEEFRTVSEVKFVASHEGKFRFRCSTTCGYMHPFMQGELIVAPNRLYPASALLSVSTAFLMLLWFGRSSGQGEDEGGDR